MGNQLTATATPLISIENCLNGLTNIEYVSLLGSSRFLKVAKARHNEGLLVIKVFVNQNNIPLSMYREDVNILKVKLENVPWCLPCFQTILIENNIAYLVRQYVKCNLYIRMNTRPFLNDIDKKWIAYQILSALNHLAILKVCHGDLKLENILLTSWNWVLISDFASYKPLTLPEDNPSDFSFFFDTSRRRICYLAPERFVSNSMNPNSSAAKNNIEASTISTFMTTTSSSSTLKPHMYLMPLLESDIVERNPDLYEVTEACENLLDSKTTIGASANVLNKNSTVDAKFHNHILFKKEPRRLTPEMDLFSAGCLLIEFFAEGTPPFSFSQLLLFKRGEYFPNSVINKVSDLTLRQVLTDMISLDPADRPSAQECLKLLMSEESDTFLPIAFTYCAKYVNDLNPVIGDVKIARLKNDFLNHTNPKLISKVDLAQAVLMIHLVLSVIELPPDAKTISELKKCMGVESDPTEKLGSGGPNHINNTGHNSKFYDVGGGCKQTVNSTGNNPFDFGGDGGRGRTSLETFSGLKFESSYMDGLTLLTTFLNHITAAPFTADSTERNCSSTTTFSNYYYSRPYAAVIEELVFNEMVPYLIYLITYGPKPDLLAVVNQKRLTFPSSVLGIGSSNNYNNVTDKIREKAMETLVNVLESVLLYKENLLLSYDDTQKSDDSTADDDLLHQKHSSAVFFGNCETTIENANLFLDFVIPKLNFALSPNSNLCKESVIALKIATVKNISRLTLVSAKLLPFFVGVDPRSLLKNKSILLPNNEQTSSSLSSLQTFKKLDEKLKNRFQDLIVHRLLDSDSNAATTVIKNLERIPAYSEPIPSTFASDIKRMLLVEALPNLCHFFGPEKSKDVLLSHAVTFLNDKQNPELRSQLFQSLPFIVLPILKHPVDQTTSPILPTDGVKINDSDNNIALPLIRQGLRDPDEFVIINALGCFYTLIQRRFFKNFRSVQEIILDLAPFLCHPNKRIRRGVCGCIFQLAKCNIMDTLDFQVKILPILSHYFVAVNLESENLLFDNLKEPLSRQLYQYILQNPKPLLFESVRRSFCEEFMITPENKQLQKELLTNKLACIAHTHLTAKLNDNHSLPASIYQLKFDLSSSAYQAKAVETPQHNHFPPSSNVAVLESNQVITKLMALGYRPGFDGEKIICLQDTIVKISDYFNPQALITTNPKPNPVINVNRGDQQNKKVQKNSTPSSSSQNLTDKTTISDKKFYPTASLSVKTLKLNNEIRLTTTSSQIGILPIASKEYSTFEPGCGYFDDVPLNLQPSLMLISPTHEFLPSLPQQPLTSVSPYEEQFKIGKGPPIRLFGHNKIVEDSYFNDDNLDLQQLRNSHKDNKVFFEDYNKQSSPPPFNEHSSLLDVSCAILPKSSYYVPNFPNPSSAASASPATLHICNDEWQQMFGSAEDVLQELEKQTFLEEEASFSNHSPLKNADDNNGDMVKIERSSSLITNNSPQTYRHPQQRPSPSLGNFHISVLTPTIAADGYATSSLTSTAATTFTANNNKGRRHGGKKRAIFEDASAAMAASFMARTETDLIAIPSTCRVRMKKLLASKELAASARSFSSSRPNGSGGGAGGLFDVYYDSDNNNNTTSPMNREIREATLDFVVSNYADSPMFKDIDADAKSGKGDDCYENPVSHYILTSMIEDAAEKDLLSPGEETEASKFDRNNNNNETLHDFDNDDINNNYATCNVVLNAQIPTPNNSKRTILASTTPLPPPCISTNFIKPPNYNNDSHNNTLFTTKKDFSSSLHYDLRYSLNEDTSKFGPTNWKPFGCCVSDLSYHKGYPVNQIKTSPNRSTFASCSNNGILCVWNPSKLYEDIPLNPILSRSFENLRCKSMGWLNENTIVAGFNRGTLQCLHLDHEVKVMDKYEYHLPDHNEHDQLRRDDLNVTDVIAINDKVFLALINTGQVLGFDLRVPIKQRSSLNLESDSSNNSTQSNPIFVMEHYKRRRPQNLNNTFSPSLFLPAPSNINLESLNIDTMDEDLTCNSSVFSDLSLEGPYTCMAYDANSYFLVTGSASGVHTCWDMRFRLPVSHIQHPNRSRIRNIFIHPNKPSKFYSCSSMDNEIALWDVYSGTREKVLWASEAPPLSSHYLGESLQNNKLFDKENFERTTATLQEENTWWDIKTPSPRQCNFICDTIFSSDLSHEGYIISAGSDMCIRYWDLYNPTNSYHISSPKLTTPTKQFQAWKSSIFKTASRGDAHASRFFTHDTTLRYETRLIEGVSMIIEQDTTRTRTENDNIHEEGNSIVPPNDWYNVCHRDTITSLAVCDCAFMNEPKFLPQDFSSPKDNYGNDSDHDKTFKTYEAYMSQCLNEVCAIPHTFLVSGSYDGIIKLWV